MNATHLAQAISDECFGARLVDAVLFSDREVVLVFEDNSEVVLVGSVADALRAALPVPVPSLAA